jgi:hypothetical protein
MPYTPPSGSAVTLVFRGGYVPPAGGSVTLVFGAGDNALFTNGWDSQIFGTTFVSHRNRTVAPPSAGNSLVLGTPNIDLYTRYVQPPGFTQLTFGAAFISNKNRFIFQGGAGDVSVFGTTKVENRNKQYTPAGFATDAYGTPTISRNPQVASGVSLGDKAAYGTAKVYSNKLFPGGEDQSAFGASTFITLFNRYVLEIGGDTMEFGQPSVRTNKVFPNGFETMVVAQPVIYFYDRLIFGIPGIPPGGPGFIADGTLGKNGFGTPTVTSNKMSATCGDQLKMGTPQVSPTYVKPSGWDSQEFPIRSLFPFIQGVVVTSNKHQATGWDSMTFGTPTIDFNPHIVTMTGWDSARFGFNDFTYDPAAPYPGVTHGSSPVLPPSIPPSLTFGEAHIGFQPWTPPPPPCCPCH